MDVKVAYRGSSRLADEGPARVLRLEPDIQRDRVAFDAPLTSPLRLREAISTLHDIVVSDLRPPARDRTAYREWKRRQAASRAELRRREYDRARKELETRETSPVTRELEHDHRRCLRRYWSARRAYDAHLRRSDPALWRKIMPYDPVITVDRDVVLFECFSADESSYGCLAVDRDGGFGPARLDEPGTTNVDYSWDLYDHFQRLRSYRETRLTIDPGGIDVRTEEAAGYREETIDLPASWLRGFLQVQGAMALPTRRVTLEREVLYSLLAWLRRHRARTSPRAIRFELTRGERARLVLEPWERTIESHGAPWDGPSGEPVRIWGRRRLLALARLLPLVESVDVHLLGTGLPSFWVARMGEMRLTLALSGWTANDWTGGTGLDLLAPPREPGEATVDRVARFLRRTRRATLDEVARGVPVDPLTAGATLNHLASAGQVIHDLPAGIYRWRQILPRELGEARRGEPSEEAQAADLIAAAGKVKRPARSPVSDRTTLWESTADGKPVEILLGEDGRIHGGRCPCGHYRRFGLRSGPCRHMIALRRVVLSREQAAVGPGAWFEQMRLWTRR